MRNPPVRTGVSKKLRDSRSFLSGIVVRLTQPDGIKGELFLEDRTRATLEDGSIGCAKKYIGIPLAGAGGPSLTDTRTALTLYNDPQQISPNKRQKDEAACSLHHLSGTRASVRSPSLSSLRGSDAHSRAVTPTRMDTATNTHAHPTTCDLHLPFSLLTAIHALSRAVRLCGSQAHNHAAASAALSSAFASSLVRSGAPHTTSHETYCCWGCCHVVLLSRTLNQ
jgi:hypothetical protein